MKTELLTIRDSSLPAPKYEQAVVLEGNTGIFPSLLESPVLHGFWWANPENTSYVKELKVSATEQDGVRTVKRRISTFLRSRQMNEIDRVIVLGPFPSCISIDSISKRNLKSKGVLTERGRYVEVGAAFTTMPHIPLYGLAADCTWTIVSGTTSQGEPLMGLVHSGRAEANLKFPELVVEYLRTKFGCIPQNIQMGIIPSLEPEHHTVRVEDVDRCFANKLDWLPYIREDKDAKLIRADIRSYVADQYIRAGVSPENIELYLTGTYASAMEGFGFSHRGLVTSGLKDGSFCVATQLRG